MQLTEAAVQRVVAEFADAELGDERRTARATCIVEGLCRAPGASLPDAMGTEAALEGAYRFVGHPGWDYEDLLLEHHERTGGRACEAGTVLVLHDTTTCSFGHIPAEELGYLQTGKAGFFLHVSLVVDARHPRRPLGVVHAEAYWRKRRSGRGSRQLHANGETSAQWTDREFLRWHRGVAYSSERLEGCDAIHVMDREGDSFALLADMVQAGHRFVVRARHNRKLSDERTLDQAVESCSGILEREVVLTRRKAPTAPRAQRATPGRKGRKAKLRFSATRVTIAKPRSCGTEAPEQLTLNLVHVQEVNTPQGEAPVQWTLWTTEPVDTPAQVAAVVDAYRQRWVIEELFKALKTGCSYESRQLETRHALLNLLALSLPIAVELLWLRSRATDDPQAPATDVLSELQIRILRQLSHRPLPNDSPTAAQALLALAGLAGHQRSNGPPGWQILKRAYEKLLAYEVGWTAALQSPKM